MSTVVVLLKYAFILIYLKRRNEIGNTIPTIPHVSLKMRKSYIARKYENNLFLEQRFHKQNIACPEELHRQTRFIISLFKQYIKVQQTSQKLTLY